VASVNSVNDRSWCDVTGAVRWGGVRTLDGESEVGVERLRGHLVRRGAPVDGVVVGRTHTEHQLVLGPPAATHVREVQLLHRITSHHALAQLLTLHA